jgi:hypothetical protein
VVMSPAELGPENDCAGEDSSNCKRQTRPLVRGGAPYQQTRKCLTIFKNLVISPRWGLDIKTDWPTGRRSSYNRSVQYQLVQSGQLALRDGRGRNRPVGLEDLNVL